MCLITVAVITVFDIQIQINKTGKNIATQQIEAETQFINFSLMHAVNYEDEISCNGFRKL